MLSDLTPAQRELAVYMSQLSEEAYSAGWMEDLEYQLWRALSSGPFRYGQLTLTPAPVQKLKSLSPTFRGSYPFADTREESFVPVAQWTAVYQHKLIDKQ